MKRLIVNIDDFGMSQDINRGIIECLKFGIAKSTTIMVRMPYAENAVKLAKENEFTFFGVHLDLTEGHPIIPGRSLIPIMLYLKRNRIDKAKKIINGLNLDLKDIEKELQSQVDWLLEREISVTHLDSHHGIHGFPGINEIVLKIAGKLKLPVRHWQVNGSLPQGIKGTGYYSEAFYGRRSTKKQFKKIVESYTSSSMEIMSHAGYAKWSFNPRLPRRNKELKILTDLELKRWLLQEDVELIGYNDL